MSQNNLDDIPELMIGFNDLAVLRSVIPGYRSYLRWSTFPEQERRSQLHLLEGVYQRLSGIPPTASQVHIFLDVPEIHALNRAMLGFAAFVRQKVSPSRDRDETLQSLEDLRQALVRFI